MLLSLIKEFLENWLASNGFILSDKLESFDTFGNELIVYESSDCYIRFIDDRGDLYIDLASSVLPKEWFLLDSLLEIQGYRHEIQISDAGTRAKHMICLLKKEFPALRQLLSAHCIEKTKESLKLINQQKINELMR
jgi:hypothetical protein